MERKRGEVRIDSDRVKSPMYWPVRNSGNDDWRRDMPEPRVTERIVGGVVRELAAVNPVVTPMEIGMGSAQVLNGARPLHMTARENWNMCGRWRRGGFGPRMGVGVYPWMRC